MCSQFHLQRTSFQVKPFGNLVKTGLNVILTRKITQKPGYHIQKLTHFTHTELAHSSAGTCPSGFILSAMWKEPRAKLPVKLAGV